MHLGSGLFMTKDSWQWISKIGPVPLHIKQIALQAFLAKGLKIQDFSVSGKRGSTSIGDTKPAVPQDIVKICKGIIFHK
jgi:hypothetical protein